MWLLFPALAGLVALVVIVAFLRSEAGRERRRGMIVAAIVAALFAIGGIFLLGIPGALVYGVSLPVVQLLLGARYEGLADGAWGAAILITLTWPASLVIADAVANGPLRRRGRGARWAARLLIPCAAGVALTLWAHLSA
jgi:hypothetical protein